MTLMRRPISKARRIAFAGVMVLGFLVIVEIALKRTGWDKAPSEHVYDDVFEAAYQVLPNVRVPFGNPARSPADQTNHAGFRGPEFIDRKPAGTYRILSMGDSTTFGVLVDESETYSRRLEQRLRPRWSPRIEVLNAGVPGSNIFAHRLVLERHAPKYQPDLAIVYVLFNAQPETETLRRLHHEAEAQDRSPFAAVQRALRGSHLYRLLRRQLKGEHRSPFVEHVAAIHAQVGAGHDVEWRWLQEGFTEDLTQLAALCRRNRIHLVPVFNLTEYIVDQAVMQKRDPDRPVEPDANMHHQLFLLADDVLRKEGVELVSALPRFVEARERGEKLFLDLVHFSPAGHAIMADVLADSIGSHAGEFGLESAR
jgi:lysophospholipase L1-like esterase